MTWWSRGQHSPSRKMSFELNGTGVTAQQQVCLAQQRKHVTCARQCDMLTTDKPFAARR